MIGTESARENLATQTNAIVIDERHQDLHPLPGLNCSNKRREPPRIPPLHPDDGLPEGGANDGGRQRDYDDRVPLKLRQTWRRAEDSRDYERPARPFIETSFFNDDRFDRAPSLDPLGFEGRGRNERNSSSSTSSSSETVNDTRNRKTAVDERKPRRCLTDNEEDESTGPQRGLSLSVN